MDLSNRNVQPQAAAPGPQNPAAGVNNKNLNKRGRHGSDKGRWSRILSVALVVIVGILIAAVIAVVVAGSSNAKSESEYVDSSKLQAVFLNTGQVYFGNIKTMTGSYVVLTNIYYLQAANNNNGSANADSNNNSNNITLVKLGCELHEPYDQMVINSDQITFWENLQDNGQVAKAVSTFEKQNPNGQKCADQSSSASTDSGSNAQNADSKKNE